MLIYHPIKIHRLVALVFILNPYNKEQVNHIDENKQNNKVINLEWCTNQENQIHKVNSGLVKVKPIIQYDLNMNKIKVFKSQTEASKALNIPISNVTKVTKPDRYTFRFKTDNVLDIPRKI